MSLNNSQMLPARVRNMRQMNDVLNAEDIILAEIERIIDEMYQRASLLHEELINEPDEWGISYDMGDVEVLESVELNVSVSATSQLQEMFTDAGVVIGFDSPYWNVRRLNGTWQMDGSYELNVLRKPDTYGLAIDLGNTNIEEMTPGGVVIKKDLWLLDGSYQLNGTRILDAIRREEEL